MRHIVLADNKPKRYTKGLGAAYFKNLTPFPNLVLKYPIR